MMTLNHGLSGYVCGRVLSPVAARYAPWPQGLLVPAMFLGAMLPDLDALGTLLGPHVYFSRAWYGHRMASHSVLGGAVLAAVAAALLWVPARRWAGGPRCITVTPPAPSQPRARLLPRLLWLWGACWLGTLLHIVGDLVTPGMAMPVLWPLPARFGAWAHIGWFSPYLLWLFLTVLLLDAVGSALRRRAGAAWRARLGVALWAVHAVAAYRWLQYLAQSRYVSAGQWQAYQLELLPASMVTPMTATIHRLWQWLSG